MENKKNNGLLIPFILVLVVAILGVVGTIYFYNKSLNSNEVTENNTSVKKGTTSAFTDLIELSLSNDENIDVTVGGKLLSFKIDNNFVYLNGKKIKELQDETKYITVTNRMILLINNAGQFGYNYSFYDLEGNAIKFTGGDTQYYDLRVEDGKLKVNAFIPEKHWMDGYIIGNLLTEPDDTSCSKRLKDYPKIVDEHKNDVLSADYYLDLVGNELSLKVEKVNLTVADLDPNTCVSEN